MKEASCPCVFHTLWHTGSALCTHRHRQMTSPLTVGNHNADCEEGCENSELLLNTVTWTGVHVLQADSQHIFLSVCV